MTAVNQVGNALTGSTGTGAFVGSISPTITTPKIGTIDDTNGNPMLLLNAVGSAVNYFSLTNNATTGPINLSAGGSDSNIGITFATKGTGTMLFQSTATSNQFTYYAGTSLVSINNFSFPSASGTQTYAFPDASGTVGLITADTTFTPVFTSSGGGTATYSLQSGTYTQIGNLIFYNILLSLTALPSAGNVTITGLPVAAQSSVNFACAIQANTLNAATSALQGAILGGGTTIFLNTYAAGALSQLTVGGCTNTSSFTITGHYHI